MSEVIAIVWASAFGVMAAVGGMVFEEKGETIHIVLAIIFIVLSVLTARYL